MANSPSQSDALPPLLPPDAESPLASVVYELSQQVQVAMENMLKMINEIDQNSSGIMEDIEKSKDSAVEKKRLLEEEKERFQKAAYAALDMLNGE
ncbi:hypothetical protein FNV43_RR11191 [Rhamnella rubrinervis]|uniref:Polyamine-modulated factor 1-binding protein n=1 Tax=Rhamnella rubrinervis TaxID=2594499 RepID=A0A8K0H5I8_9ROSA|nr:hypothetical protein FNV43_RR11191 [Rhamnella rubrinervis]